MLRESQVPKSEAPGAPAFLGGMTFHAGYPGHPPSSKPRCPKARHLGHPSFGGELIIISRHLGHPSFGGAREHTAECAGGAGPGERGPCVARGGDGELRGTACASRSESSAKTIQRCCNSSADRVCFASNSAEDREHTKRIRQAEDFQTNCFRSRFRLPWCETRTARCCLSWGYSTLL